MDPEQTSERNEKAGERRTETNRKIPVAAASGGTTPASKHPEEQTAAPAHTSPSTLVRRVGRDVDRLFGGLFSLSSLSGLSFARADARWPELEIRRRGNKLVVLADVPGMRREDLNVEIHEDELKISGSRHEQREHRNGDYYRSERSYGSFCRTIGLPPGAKADSAVARFDRGVLEVEVDVPDGGASARKVEVRETPSR